MKKLTHLDNQGELRMVDVSGKPAVPRQAVARGEIFLQAATLHQIQAQTVAKGNVLAAARLAGISAAKRTSELIPLCHPLAITYCEVEFDFPPSSDRIVVTARTRYTGRTGVEMEALTAVSIAALTIYDMCKAVDKSMRLSDIRLISKSKGVHHVG